MIRDDLKNEIIHGYIRHKMSNYNEKLVDLCIQTISEQYFPNRKLENDLAIIPCLYEHDIVEISRKKVLKYILTLNSNIQTDYISHFMPAIMKAYPILKCIRQVFIYFHSMIMGNDPEKLDNFLEMYEKTELSSFCNGIKKDKEAVKNTIIHHDISSGFVEGNNNKFKVIKRTSYGRNKLKSLETKSCMAFAMTKIANFTVRELIFNGKTAGCRSDIYTQK